MTQTLKKRCLERGALPDSIDILATKRERTDCFLQLLQFDKTLADETEECSPTEEVVNGVMRSLEQEIAGISCTSYLTSNFVDNSAAYDISNGPGDQTLASDSGIDLCYLLEASDDELGIPPNPYLSWKDEVHQFPKEISEGLWETPDLQSLGENWLFEDDFENYQQFTQYENALDPTQHYILDFVSQGMLFDWDLPAAC